MGVLDGDYVPYGEGEVSGFSPRLVWMAFSVYF